MDQILSTAKERRGTVIVSSSIYVQLATGADVQILDWCLCEQSFLEMYFIYICGEKTAPGKSGTVTKSQEPRDLETFG